MKSESKTEQEMRAEKAPWPTTLDELKEYVASLTDRDHDYGTCVYAMSLAATAAFQHVAHKLGVTGFQASCADLDIVRRTRSMEGPFILLKGEDMLYPQYDLPGKLREAMGEWAEWAAEQAAKKLAKNKQDAVHPSVWAHWVTLAAHKSNKELPVSGYPANREDIH
jgi:hypothetical protein